MSVRSAQSITTVFTTRTFSTGAATNADSTPTGTLYLNGTADGATVTVTNLATGKYKAAVTLPTLAVGDVVSIVIAATVNSVADNAKIWEDTKDVFAGALPDVIAGGAGGLFIAGSNAATTTAGLTTGALACTTITASGAVAFQSTFAVTTSSSFGAFSCTTLTASGAVAFQSTFAVTTSTALGALSGSTVTFSGAVAFQSTFIVTGATTFTGNVGMAAGLNITQSTTNGSGLVVTGNGSGSGILATGGVTGHGGRFVGGATSGDGILALATTLGHGLDLAGAGNSRHGIATQGGGTNGYGISASGGTSGAGVFVTSSSGDGMTISGAGAGLTIAGSAGNGVTITASGASKHGVSITGGDSGTSDALKLTAGSGGVGLRVDTITVSGAVTLSSTLTVSGTTSLAAVSTSGTLTVNAFTCTNNFTVSGNWLTTGTTTWTGAAAFSAGLTSNITGTLSTVTTLTNLPAITAGWLTATGIAADAITAAKIADGAIDTATFASGTTIPRCTLTDTLTTYTGNTVQTGDVYAQTNSGTFGLAAIKGYVDDIGVAGAGLTALGDTRIANLDAAVTSRMASYTQPTGFLAATFPSGTIANTTNITAGTITTASAVTTVNGLAAGVITAAAIADGAIDAATFATGAIDAAALAADAGTEIGTAVWASTTRLLTAGTNIVLAKGVGVTGFTDLSAAQVNAEADTALADYDGPTHAEMTAELATADDVTLAAIAALNNITAASVWAAATRTLTAGTNIQLPSNGLALVTAWTVAITGNITGNLSGSIGSYTGNTPQTGDAFARLGAPAGASVSADVAAVKVDTAAILDDTGTSGVVVVAGSKTGYALTSAYDFAKGTVAMTEAYAANGVAPTPVQAMFAIQQYLTTFSIVSTAYTVKKLDGATTAFVVTINDATTPTGATRT